jgi:YegS/Rv2252/BmrU family lipid kinase
VRSLALLVNPHAAGGRPVRLLPRIEARLRALGLPFRAQRTDSLLHGCELAREAASRGEVAVTLSGDGLIGAVAGALRDVPGAVLGVLPGGRGNDFARMIGLPLDAVAACDVLATGRPAPIDLGAADGRTFLGIASLGFDSDANRIANEAKLIRGNLVYLYAALRAVLGWKHANFRVTVDDEVHELRGWSVGVCNSKAYGGGMYVAPHARLDDGRLDVVSCQESSKWTFLRQIVPSSFKGTLLDNPLIRTYRGEVIELAADRPFTIYADGDPIGELPATVRVSPRSLRVLVPRAS